LNGDRFVVIGPNAQRQIQLVGIVGHEVVQRLFTDPYTHT